jgi:1,4-alpha-glucan branching enzyme
MLTCPWVRHTETAHSMEEDWLHCAIVETHLPLLEMMFRLRDEGVPFHLTLNLSPTLLAMFQDRIPASAHPELHRPHASTLS